MPFDFPSKQQRSIEFVILSDISRYLAVPTHWNKGYLTFTRKLVRTHCLVGAIDHYSGLNLAGPYKKEVTKLVYHALPWYIPKFARSTHQRGWIELFNDAPWTTHRAVKRVLQRAQASAV